MIIAMRVAHFAEEGIARTAFDRVVKNIWAYFTDKTFAHVLLSFLLSLQVRLFQIKVFRVQTILARSNRRLYSLMNNTIIGSELLLYFLLEVLIASWEIWMRKSVIPDGHVDVSLF
jgi:hypothetical protein